MSKRHKYIFVGVLLLLFGLQFRWVRELTLTPAAGARIAKYERNPLMQTGYPSAAVPAQARTVVIPPWLSYSCIFGGVLLVVASATVPKG